MRMREYSVEFTHITKKYARISVEAESEKKAIAKVRDAGLDWEDFEENETAVQNLWTTDNSFGFYDWLKSLFR